MPAPPQPVPHLTNRAARHIFLARHLLTAPLAGAGQGAALADLIQALGFVQLDSIATVARAHHMILHARAPSYRPKALDHLLARDRAVFEHWTHDASVIPMAFRPYWRLKFARDEARLRTRWKRWQRHGVDEKAPEVLARIRAGGACCSADMRDEEAAKSTGWWDWHPGKTALEYLWRSGELAVCHRRNFQKHYDLAERIIPPAILTQHPSEAEVIDWSCNAAMDRLGFATPGELAAFWDIITPAEAKAWAEAQQQAGRLIAVDVGSADGSARRHLARPEILAGTAPEPTAAMRVLSPFDPALRDRARAERLFGFRYRIEVFTPAARREYGYYVFPLLEGDRLVGRIDMKAHRAEGHLHVTALWPERGVRFGKGRLARLDRALARTARLAECDRVTHAPGWLREAK